VSTKPIESQPCNVMCVSICCSFQMCLNSVAELFASVTKYGKHLYVHVNVDCSFAHCIANLS